MKDRRILLLVLGIFILLVGVMGYSYSFFSYLLNGNENTVKVGEIEFTSSDKTIEVTNVFPTIKEESEDVATVSVEGYTTYENGIDFTIKAVNVVPQNTNIIPTVVVERETIEGITYTDGKTETTTYDKNNRLTSDTILCTGHVEGNTRVGSIEELVKLLTISVYYDKEEYHISDNTKEQLIQYGMLPQGYAGEVISTANWNALSKDSEGNEVIAYSFKIEVTAVEGEAQPTMLSAVDTIKSKVGTDGLVAVNTNGELASEGDEIREYRYSGSAKYCTYTVDGTTYNLAVEGDTCPNATGTIYTCKETDVACNIAPNEVNPIDGEVDNYIWFNNEMWRIIGVFNETTVAGTETEVIKIIREVPLTNGEVPSTYSYNGTSMVLKYEIDYQYAYMYWNYDKYFNQVNYNDWTKSATQYYLNDETVGANSYYNSIDATYQRMIETVQYNISNVDEKTTAKVMYTTERSGNKYDGNEAMWTGKIGMMYPSDYAYAATSSAWVTTGYEYGKISYPATLNNWMEDNRRVFEWTISPGSFYLTYAVRANGIGNLFADDASQNIGAVSPVLYLKSDVVISGGTGDEGSPYQLSLN